ncbi:HAUS augmin-like complex subunit 5 [Aphelocoma coerulescens]|uniref:HAUS augmin-like complex subunit 5 n=1 Tax=Aphelocoma coerulescens TaxID=39617 RepID=UPI003604AE5D
MILGVPRLCSGPGAPIWDFVARHVRSLQNVKKIRGNLRRYREAQEEQAAPGPPSRQGALKDEVARLRKEVQGLQDAIGRVQEVAQHLEASLEARQSRRWAELQRGAELRLLGAGPSPEGLRGGHQGALRAPPLRPGQSRAELSAMLASGAEPEVLVSIRALCQAREAELKWPRPPREPREKPPPPRDWLERAEAVLIGHSPQAVLWALETLANQSTRALLAGPAPPGPAPPPPSRLLQERWGAVGGVWAALAPLLARLARLRGRLEELQPRLGREPRAQRAARLALLRAGLGGFWGALSRGVQGLRGDPPKSPKSPKSGPESALGGLRRRLRRGRGRALRQQQRLRFLSAATRGRRAGLRPLQEQVLGVARAGPGSAPPPLVGEGQRRRRLVLGALGEPLPPPAPPPLRALSRELGTGPEQGALLRRAAALRLRLRQGALWARGAGPEPGPPLPPPPPPGPPLPPPGGAELLLPRLRLVGAGCRQRIRDWPRLRGLLGQWWAQPAQWVLATPPGHAPFSHWLQRWRDAARALQATPTPEMATPTPEMATPTPELATPTPELATPTGEGEGRGEVAPPL